LPGHEGIVANETADQFARTGSEHPFIGPEPACGISVGVAKKAVRNWTNRNHTKKNIGKGFIVLEPSARRTNDLLKLNRDQFRTVYRTLSLKRTPFRTAIDR
jgi:hypothetical protein